ncbi:MAG: hypothetical protein IPJ69_07940 [Deltaproteobacteria bacterium]|nr:MAG: hypothetical protein IPJ69_07940 [Deltaproteobacteria bacterium]
MSVLDLVKRSGLPVEMPRYLPKQWKRALEVDKKSRGGMIQYVFVRDLGCVETRPILPLDLALKTKKL